MSTPPLSPIYISPTASTYTYSASSYPDTPPSHPPSHIQAFHNSLPSFNTTPLVPIPLSLPLQNGTTRLPNLYLKAETSRLSLPAFKILGASWATYITLCDMFSLPPNPNVTTLGDVSRHARRKRTELVAATDGNHGRAVGRMSKILSETGLEDGEDFETGPAAVAENGNEDRGNDRVRATIFVPDFTDDATISKIASEGVNGSVRVIQVNGNYDDAVQAAAQYSNTPSDGDTHTHTTTNINSNPNTPASLKIHIQDNAFENYTTIPHHISAGYTTMFTEISAQLAHLDQTPDFIVTPVGVGSLAHAVVKFAKAAPQSHTYDQSHTSTRVNSYPDSGSKSIPQHRRPTIITVEPQAAPCLTTNLLSNTHFTVPTHKTIMDGLCCGTVSPTAWPVLRQGVDVSVTVGEGACHGAVLSLNGILKVEIEGDGIEKGDGVDGSLKGRAGLEIGPCGAAGLAGLSRVWEDEGVRRKIGLREESVVVILGTEGARGYVVPE